MSLIAQTLSVRLGRRTVLDAVDLTLAPRVVTAVVGPNGAGKSTLLACLAGLRRPLLGEVSLDGAPLQTMSPRARARHIGFLPQTPEVAWSVDVRTLVGLGRTPHLGTKGLTEVDRIAVAEAMTATDTGGFAERPVDSLSGGERGRVLIARVLAGRPDWILADEPLTGLDPGHQIDALELLRQLAHRDGKGVVLTLHDLSLALRLADRVIVLSQGRILADGDPAAALTPGVLAEAYGLQARVLQGDGGALLDIVGRRP